MKIIFLSLLQNSLGAMYVYLFTYFNTFNYHTFQYVLVDTTGTQIMVNALFVQLELTLTLTMLWLVLTVLKVI